MLKLVAKVTVLQCKDTKSAQACLRGRGLSVASARTREVQLLKGLILQYDLRGLRLELKGSHIEMPLMSVLECPQTCDGFLSPSLLALFYSRC